MPLFDTDLEAASSDYLRTGSPMEFVRLIRRLSEVPEADRATWKRRIEDARALVEQDPETARAARKARTERMMQQWKRTLEILARGPEDEKD